MKLKDLTAQKKILFINFDKHKELIEKELENCVFIGWDEVFIDNGKLSYQKQSFNDLKFVFVGAVGDNLPKYVTIVEFLKNNSIPSLLYGAAPNIENKFLQSFLFKQLGIAQPRTFITNTKNFDADRLIADLKLPIIAKITDGSQGKGIEKLESKSAVIRFLKANVNKEFIFQEFIDNDCDYRCFFFKNELLYTIKRQRKANTKEFRNNVSLGADQSFIDLDIPTKQLAQKINCCLRLYFAGIDIVQSKQDGKWYVFEINSAPQYINKEHLVIPRIIQYIRNYS